MFVSLKKRNLTSIHVNSAIVPLPQTYNRAHVIPVKAMIANTLSTHTAQELTGGGLAAEQGLHLRSQYDGGVQGGPGVSPEPRESQLHS